MRRARRFGVLLLAQAVPCLWGCRASPAGGLAAIALPNGGPGIGFDDLRFSPALGVIAPGGRSGDVDLVDPSTRSVTAIGGFSQASSYSGGHDQGATSADADGGGLLFVTDRTAQRLYVVDPAARAIRSSAPTAASPDYARFVAATGEVWISEPDASQIEIFTIGADAAHTPAPAALLATAGGPESLVIDGTRGRAYTHLWNGATYAIDVRARAIMAQWPNGCGGSRGIALDEARGFLFAGCSEGKAVVLDLAGAGRQLASLAAGSGVDVIDYSPTLHHLYLPGASSATLAILGVSAQGQLMLLGTHATVSGGHCVTADDQGNAYVCDPDNGELLVVPDPYPATTG